jgi:hypothetical protein
MKRVVKIAIILLIAGFFPFRSFSQVTMNSSVNATIVTIIGLTKTYDLDFGNMAVTTASGTCVLAPVAGSNPTRTISGGVTLPAFYGTPRSAEFTVTGVPSQLFTITIPPADITITNGVSSMIVNGYTTDQNVITPGSTWYGTFGPNGTTVHIGATVSVSAGQPSGIYKNLTGFPVTFNYQ